MKVKLIFVFVGIFLVLASSARADFTISTRYTDGTEFNPDIDTLDIEESLYLSIVAEETVQGGLSVYYWDLICDSSLGTITGGTLGPDGYGGNIRNPYLGDNGRGGYFAYMPYDPNDDPMTYTFGMYEAGTYADYFLYSPQSLGNVTIEFWGSKGRSSPPEDSFEIVDLLVINQVPEPATLLLFGIGAVMLRWKR